MQDEAHMAKPLRTQLAILGVGQCMDLLQSDLWLAKEGGRRSIAIIPQLLSTPYMPLGRCQPCPFEFLYARKDKAASEPSCGIDARLLILATNSVSDYCGVVTSLFNHAVQ